MSGCLRAACLPPTTGRIIRHIEFLSPSRMRRSTSWRDLWHRWMQACQPGRTISSKYLHIKKKMSEPFWMEGVTRTEPPLSRACCVGPILYPPIVQCLFYGRLSTTVGWSQLTWFTPITCPWHLYVKRQWSVFGRRNSRWLVVSAFAN